MSTPEGGPAESGRPAGEPSQAPACPACGEPVPAGARFCEACGADLPGAHDGTRAAGPADGVDGEVVEAGHDGAAEADGTGDEATVRAGEVGPAAPAAARPCRECGGVVDADGYCTTCGAKAPSARDHLELHPRSWLAGVSDRGLRHHRNEDALAVGGDETPGGRAALVVCDGVSSAPGSDVASLAAARAALAVLLGSRAQGLGTPGARVAVTSALLADAADAAGAAVEAATPAERLGGSPSCTLVAAVVSGDLVVAGVVGDSRVYWVPDDGEPVQMTVDDSWAALQVAAGTPREVAERGPRAHAITRWVGVDSPDHTPRVTTLAVEAPGWVVACSDGLWNYASRPAELGGVVLRAAATAGGDPLETAAALTDWANAQGGHDNITVALARLDGPGDLSGRAAAGGRDQERSERTRPTGGPG